MEKYRKHKIPTMNMLEKKGRTVSRIHQERLFNPKTMPVRTSYKGES